MSRFEAFANKLWDYDQNARGKLFERVCKWFLENDPSYRRQVRTVWLWNDWPERWGPDAGIDLVAKTRSGELWAIQSKAYDPAYSVTKPDVDTFLSESARKQFAYRLLIATTDNFSRNALRTIQAQEKPVGVLRRTDLERSAVNWPASPEDLHATPASAKTPRPHQFEALDAIVDGFDQGDRGQLIMACGTGKTLVGLWLSEKYESRRTLVLSPTLTLVSETLREWANNASRDFAFLPVCSDESVADKDHMVASIADLGLPASSDPSEIASFLSQSGPLVVFSTYHSSPAIAQAFAMGSLAPFDLVIADEAHRCAGAVTSDFATILDENAISARRRLFMTATPRYFTGRIRKIAGEADFELASMDDPEKFGPVFHRLNFSQAIKRKLLSDYQVVIVGVDDETYRRYAEEGRFVTIDGKAVTDARTLASHIALAKAMRKYDLRRVLTFHGRIDSARAFSEGFPNVVEWMPEGERFRQLSQNGPNCT